MGYVYNKYGQKVLVPDGSPKKSVQPVQYKQKKSSPGIFDVIKELPSAAVKTGKGLANFFTSSEQNAGKSLGQSLFVMTGGQKQINAVTKKNMETGDMLLKFANKQTDPQKKAFYINEANKSYETAGSTSEDIMGHIRSKKQMLGDAAGVLLDALSFGTYGKAATATMKAGQLSKAIPAVLGGSQKVATTFGKGFVQGAKASAKVSTPLGVGYGLSQGMQDDKNLGGIIKSGVVGGISGLGLGGLLGGITGGISAKANANKIAEKAQNVGTYTGGVSLPATNKRVPTITKPKGEQTTQEAMKNFNESWAKSQAGRPNKEIIKTALDKSNEVRKLAGERSSYVQSKAGDPKSYSAKDIADYNNKVIKAGKEFDSLHNQSSVGAIQALQTKQPSPVSTQPQITPKELPMQSGQGLDQLLQKPSSYTEKLPQTAQSVNDIKSQILNKKLRERGFVSSIQDAKNVSGKTKINVAGGYTPKSNDTLMGEAKGLLEEGVSIKFDKIKDIDKKIAATMQEAINLDALGNHQAAANLFNNLSEHGTELGRGVQAFSMIDKMSPEAISLSAAGNIRRFNMNAKIKIPELTGTQQEFISNSIKKIQSIPAGRERNLLINELDNSLKDFIPSTFGDKLMTVWKANLLSSLRTHARNIIGNTAHGMAEIVKDIPATLNDMIVSFFKGTPRTKSFTLKTGGGIKKGIQATWDMARFGFDPEKTMEKFNIRKHTTWANTPVQQFLKKSTNIIFRALGAEDKIFYYTALGHSLQEQATTAAINANKRGDKVFIDALIKSPTDEIMANATKDAAIAVFQNKNILSKVASFAKKGLSGNEYAKFAGDFLTPFTGVPSSIAGQLSAYSPIGLTQGLINDARVLFSKSANPALQRAASHQVGRGATGTAILAAGAYLTKKGLITGEPKDPTEARQWELEGKHRNSIMLFGKSRSINSVGPEAIILLAGGEWGRQNKGKKNPFIDKVLNTAGYLGKAFTNQTFLSGIQQPLEVLTNPVEHKLSKLVGSELGSFIPNIIKDTAKAFDPYQRESNRIMDTVQSSVPFLRNKLLPKRDALGKIIPNQLTGLRSYVDLFNSAKPINNPVVNELKRLYDMGLGATPSKLLPTQSIYGQKIILTPKLLDQLEAQSGGNLSNILNKLVTSKEYQALSDEKKKEYIDSIVRAVRTGVKNKQLLPILQNALRK